MRQKQVLISFLHEKIKDLNNMLEIFLNSKINSFFIIGNAGVGKTYFVLNFLKRNKVDYAYISAYSTKLEFVNFLFLNRNKVLVIDDAEEILKDRVIIQILKSAVWNSEKRQVSYLTTSRLKNFEDFFEFCGKIIIILNKENFLDESLLQRSFSFRLNFTLKERKELLENFAKLPYENLSEQDRKEILTFIFENARTEDDLSLRTLIKAYEIFKISKENWKELVLKYVLDHDPLKIKLEEILKTSKTTKEAEIKFRELTGLSRATFFRLKRKINKERLIEKNDEKEN